MFSSRVGQFWGPWLAYAILSGIGAGLLFLLLNTLGALFLTGSIESMVSFCFYGFIGGSLAGLTAGLIGGKAGYWWSIGTPLGMAFLIPNLAPLFVLFAFSGACGVLLPRWLLSNKGGLPMALEPLSRWLRGSWLSSPPSTARLVGIFLPILIGVVVDIYVVAPVYIQNKTYASRLGFWTTWQNSYRLQTRRQWHAGSCQSNLKQIMLGVRQYTQDYDNRYPLKPLRPENGCPAVIYPYLKSAQLFQCPTEFYQPEFASSPETRDFRSGDFSDYWFNARFYALSEAQVADTSSSLLWGDGNTGMGEADAAYSLTNIPANFAPATRHGEAPDAGANYAFADGHVKWFRPLKVSNTAAPAQGLPTMVP